MAKACRSTFEIPHQCSNFSVTPVLHRPRELFHVDCVCYPACLLIFLQTLSSLEFWSSSSRLSSSIFFIFASAVTLSSCNFCLAASSSSSCSSKSCHKRESQVQNICFFYNKTVPVNVYVQRKIPECVPASSFFHSGNSGSSPPLPPPLTQGHGGSPPVPASL